MKFIEHCIASIKKDEAAKVAELHIMQDEGYIPEDETAYKTNIQILG